MPLDWQRDLSDSAADFVRIVWPVVGRWCRGGNLVPVESVTAEGITRSLDQMAGIDAWQVVGDAGIRGIASRVQYVGHDRRPYASITIRKSRRSGAETEWAKRLRAFADPLGGWLWPALTVQAYVSDRGGTGRLLYVCMVQTKALFDLATDVDGGRAYEVQTNRADGNSFAVFWCDWLHGCGVPVREWTADHVDPIRRPWRHAA